MMAMMMNMNTQMWNHMFNLMTKIKLENQGV